MSVQKQCPDYNKSPQWQKLQEINTSDPLDLQQQAKSPYLQQQVQSPDPQVDAAFCSSALFQSLRQVIASTISGASEDLLSSIILPTVLKVASEETVETGTRRTSLAK